MGYKNQVRRGGLDSSPGFLIKNPNTPHRTTMPAWDGTETQFRVFPVPTSDGDWEPIRASLEDNDFCQAVWAEPVVRRLGVKEQLTLCTRVLDGSPSPIEQFVQALHTLISEKPKEVPDDWLGWIRGSKTRSAQLPNRINTSIFFQGALVARQGKLLVNSAGQFAPQYPAILMAPVSVQIAFERAANAPTGIKANEMLAKITGNDAVAREQRDAVYAQAFQLGDWCSLKSGRVLKIYKAPEQANERPHYSLEAAGPMDLSSIAEQVRASWVPWEKLLRYFTAEEQVQLLCRAFPPEAVDYVFGMSEYAGVLPSGVRGAWVAYRQQSMVAFNAPAGQSAPQSVPQTTPYGSGAQPGWQAEQQPYATATTPAAPAPAPAAPAPAPAAPTAPVQPTDSIPSIGAPVATPPVEQPIMQDSGFNQQPAEFAQPVAAPQVPQAPQPAPAAEVPAGTPEAAVLGQDVDPAALDKALAELKAGRQQAAELTQPPQPQQ